jgi:hypothetical protein
VDVPLILTNGSGTVTSVGMSGGLTGLTYSGSPITSSGIITLSGILNFSNGGTGLSALGSPGQVIRVNALGTGLDYVTITGTGTVTSVTAGAGLSGGTITTTGTISMPNIGIAGTYGNTSQYPIITTDAQGRVTGITLQTLSASDGNKGDITVSGSGTAWNINNNVVTFSKIQNVNSGKILGRISPALGNVEELSGSDTTSLLDIFTPVLKGIVPSSGGGTVNFLRADGSWAQPPVSGGGSGTVTLVSALTLGITGTDITSSVATSTTTPVITLNIPTASLTNRGALSSGDWNLFNNKQAPITLGTIGTNGVATFAGNVLNIPDYASNPIKLSSLTAATSVNNINNTNFAQTWNWSGNSFINGLVLNYAGSNSYTSPVLLNLTSSGVNSSPGTTNIGIKSHVENTGTNTTNIGLRAVARLGTTNIGILIPAGTLNIGEAFNGETPTINLISSTAGINTIKASSSTSTWTLTLPNNAGTNGYVLSTNGAGVTSWVAQTAGTVINFADEEKPTGVKDSVNTTFTLANTPITGSLKLYLRGLRLERGVDYTISGLTLTMILIPDSGDALIADYRY